MKVEFEQNPERLAWLESRLGVTFSGPCTWLSVVAEDGSLLGVVAYTRHSAHNCEMSVAAASKRFLSKKVLKILFGYPFHQLGLRRVTSVVEDSNLESFRFNQRLGFRVEGFLRNWYGDAHGVVLGMLKEECKWI